MAVASAPDCDTKASVPGAAGSCAKLAFNPWCGASSPRQFGPRMRSTCLRAAVSTAFFCAAVSPAVMTMAARVPRAPSWRISAATPAGGVQISASSGACGSAATLGQAFTSSTVACLRLTAYSAPSKPPWRRLRHTVAPTLPGRSEAPMTATDRGCSRLSRWRMLMAGSQAAPRSGSHLARGRGHRLTGRCDRRGGQRPTHPTHGRERMSI